MSDPIGKAEDGFILLLLLAVVGAIAYGVVWARNLGSSSSSGGGIGGAINSAGSSWLKDMLTPAFSDPPPADQQTAASVDAPAPAPDPSVGNTVSNDPTTNSEDTIESQALAGGIWDAIIAGLGIDAVPIS
jgi:hypothetical protein